MNILLLGVPQMDKLGDNFYPIAMDGKKIAPPYGIYLLSAVLKRAGYQVTVVDLIAQGTNNIDPLLQELSTYDLIGIGATSFSWPTVRDIIKEIRRVNKEIPIVLGGIHPTMFDQHILQTNPVDFVVRGEGERAIVELCESLNGQRAVTEVTNLSFKTSDNSVVRNDIRGVVELSSLPLPDYSLLPSGEYSGLSIESSRGCPFDCIFCSTNYRKSYRSLGPNQFVDRIEALSPFLEKTIHRTYNIIDDEFSIDTTRVMNIMKEIATRKLSPTFVFDSRAPDLLVDDFVETIAPYVGKFLIGAECGYDEGLERIEKKTTTAILEKAAQILNSNGIAHLADFSFVIGFPWESYKGAVKTIDFATSLLMKYGVNILLQWYLQIPGSRIWQEDRKAGIVSEIFYDEYGLFRNPYLFRTGVKFTTQEIRSISDIVVSVQMMRSLSGLGNLDQIGYTHPLPIRMYFPPHLSENDDTAGLASLRELSQAARKGNHAKKSTESTNGP
jgi:anaerobic magnesium-protoporphyrin IX monomethyl ester cyclase